MQPQEIPGLTFAKFEDAAKYVLSTETKIHLDRLVFDKKKAWGQIRCLSPSIVSYYFQQLLMQGAPDVPPYVPLKKTKGLFINFP